MTNKPETCAERSRSIYVSTFTANLETLPGAVADTKTMEWWKGQPEWWFDPLPHSHRALDDTIEQGALFCNMLVELRKAGSAKNLLENRAGDPSG